MYYFKEAVNDNWVWSISLIISALNTITLFCCGSFMVVFGTWMQPIIEAPVPLGVYLEESYGEVKWVRKATAIVITFWMIVFHMATFGEDYTWEEDKE